MKNIFSNITWRTMKQNRSRTVVTVIGVILSTAMIAAVTTFGVSVQNFLIRETIRQDGNWHMKLRLPEEEAEELKKDERIDAVGTIYDLGYAGAQGLEETVQIPYFHIESYSRECMELVNLGISEGRAPENDGEILVSDFLLAMQKEEERFSVGDKLTLDLGKQMSGDTKTVTVTGIYERYEIGNDSESFPIIAGPSAQEKAAECTLVLRLKSPGDVNAFEKEVRENYSVIEFMRNSTLLRWYGVDKNDNFLLVFKRLLGIVIGLIVVASISLIYNAFSISMRERTGQFGLLSSVGATKKQLRKALRFEAWTVCLMGIPLGLFSGVAGIGITLYFVGPMLSDWTYGVSSGVPLKISPAALAAAAGIALITVQISAWIPARRMKKLSPLEAIRASRDIQKLPKRVKNTGMTGKIFGLEGMLASKNYQRDKRKYRMTVVSLTLSIVLFVTAGAFTLELKKAQQDTLTASEVDISIEGTEKTNMEKVLKELRQMDGQEEIYSYQRGYYTMKIAKERIAEDMEYQFEKAEDGTFVKECLLYVLPDEQFIRYAEEMKADPEEYINQDELKALYKKNYREYNGETGKYKNTSIMQGEEGSVMELGDNTVYDPGEKGFGVLENTFRITAQKGVEDYPRAATQNYFSSAVTFVIPESTFARAGAGINCDRMNTYVSLISEDYKKIYQELLKKTGDQESALYEASVVNRNEGKEKAQNIGTVIQVLTTGFIVLMSLIAMANVFNTVSTNLYLRRREFAMLRSAGMTQRGFRKMMGCECLIYGLRSIFYGVILSAGSSYLVHLALQGGVEFSYRFPWMYWLISAAAVLLAVGVTMIYTMGKMRKDNVIDVLKQNG